MKKLILLALATSGTALAQDPQPTQAPGASRGPNTDPTQIVCRNERVIGSRLSTNRVCRTRAEWAEANRQARQAVDRAQNQSQTSGQ